MKMMGKRKDILQNIMDILAVNKEILIVVGKDQLQPYFSHFGIPMTPQNLVYGRMTYDICNY